MSEQDIPDTFKHHSNSRARECEPENKIVSRCSQHAIKAARTIVPFKPQHGAFSSKMKFYRFDLALVKNYLLATIIYVDLFYAQETHRLQSPNFLVR
jgi:glycerol-3-phosphate dehydrogenase